ncbi:uncharacterized protein LOC111374875, partial [Olea europaea var. sylvestris]|uniref:uncharacterized protein LOC111374875 n=1 Tax=Olea europaea var. sylvestris TaxID=158386 RepID=UPI000C1D6913
KTYLFLPTAKEVWEVVKETYSDGENAAQILEIKTRLWQTKQGEREVTDYFLEMTQLWQELYLSLEEEWECTSDSGKNLRPATVTNHKRRVCRGVIGLEMNGSPSNGPKQLRGSPWYKYCRKSGHKEDTCWDLHEKSNDWKPRQNSKNRGYQASVDPTGNPKENNSTAGSAFNPKQLEQLYQIFSNLQNSARLSTHNPSSSLAHNPSNSSASDHMTDSYHLFSTYIPCAGNIKVKITDRSLSTVAKKGSIQIFESITLNSDLSSRKTIGSAREYAGLYYFEEADITKHQLSVFPKFVYKPSKPFTIIHIDLCGPSRIPNRNHRKWFVTFIDDHTWLCWVYLLKEKTDVRSVFINFHSMVQTQFQTNIQILHTDNGTKYFNSILRDYLQKYGIIHQSSCVDTPQQNGIAERKNRHLLEVACALMFTTRLLKIHLGDAILTSTYLINRMPSRTLDFETPLQKFQKLFPTSPLYSNLPYRLLVVQFLSMFMLTIEIN